MGIVVLPTVWVAKQLVPAALLNGDFYAILNQLNGNLDASNLSNLCVTAAKLAVDAVTTVKIKDGAVTQAKLGSDVIIGLNGSFKNLKVTRPSVTTVTVTADKLVIGGIIIDNVNVTANISSSGANGLMAGLSEGNKWYYIWIIRKSSDGTVAAILTESSTTIGTLPTGYDQYALVSAVHNTAGDFVDFIQQGRDYFYTAAGVPTVATGVVGSAAWTSIDVTEAVAGGLSTVVVGASFWNGSDTGEVFLSNNTAASYNNANPSPYKMGGYADGGPTIGFQFEWPLLTANTLYWSSGGSGVGYSPRVLVLGFKINKI